MKIVSFIAFILLVVSASTAQTFRYRHYTTVEGLSNPLVLCMAQDSLGFLWFGTDYGLDRFDGKKFKVFKKEDGLPGNCITALTADGNRLMIGCYSKGIAMMSNDSFQLLNSSHEAAFPIQISKFQNQFFIAPATMGNKSVRFNLFDFDTIKISCKDVDFFRYYFTQFLITADHQLLMTGEAGMFKWNGKSFDSFLKNTDQQLMDAIAQDDQQSIYAGAIGKILVIKNGKVSGAIEQGLPRDKKIHRILFDHNGRMWIAVSGAGLYLYDHGTMQFMNPKFGIGKVDINNLFLDRQNNLWICTYGEGVYCVNDMQFTNYTTADGLPNNFINCFLPTSKGILCGTFDGLGLFSKGKFEEIILPAISVKAIPSLVSVGHDSVAMAYNISGATNMDYISINDKMHHFYLFLLYTKHLFPGTHSSFLFQSRFFLTDYYPSKRRIDTIAKFPGTDMLSTYDIKKIDFKYYFASSHGLLIWDGKKFKTLNHENGLATDMVYAIAQGESKRVWLATDAGIYCLRNDSILHYTKQDGLPDNNCSSLSFDGKNNLWIGTSSGISRFDGRRFYNYNTFEGLIGNAVNTLFFDSISNQLWIGTMSGISVLNLSASLQFGENEVPVYITGLKVNKHFYANELPSQLPSANNNLSFQFIALGYANPENVVYRYRLIGLDSTWRQTSANEIQFAALLPRSYEFAVQALNSKGEIVSKPAMVSFQITPSFWQTKFFKMLMIFLTVAVVVTAFYFYLRYDRKRMEGISLQKQRELENELLKEMELNNLRQQALSAMMNPHFVFNTLNSIQQYINENDRVSANKYLTKFSRLIRLNLDLVNKNSIALEEELEKLKLYLEIEQLRFGEKLNYQFIIDQNLETDMICIPSMILQPFVENSIWHGLMPSVKGGTITLHASSFDNEKMLRIEIRDDGIGISQSRKLNQQRSRKSFGTDLTVDRLKLFGKKYNREVTVEFHDLSDLNGSGHGTLVKIELPLVFEKSLAIPTP